MKKGNEKLKSWQKQSKLASIKPKEKQQNNYTSLDQQVWNENSHFENGNTINVIIVIKRMHNKLLHIG